MGNPEQQAGDGGGRGVTLPPGGARREPLFRELFGSLSMLFLCAV